MSKVKVFVTDRQTEGQRDEWVLMSPTFAKGGGHKVNNRRTTNNCTLQSSDSGALKIKVYFYRELLRNLPVPPSRDICWRRPVVGRPVVSARCAASRPATPPVGPPPSSAPQAASWPWGTTPAQGPPSTAPPTASYAGSSLVTTL